MFIYFGFAVSVTEMAVCVKYRNGSIVKSGGAITVAVSVIVGVAVGVLVAVAVGDGPGVFVAVEVLVGDGVHVQRGHGSSCAGKGYGQKFDCG